MHADVLIVGGGLAGLACAAALARWQVDFQLLEATDRLGGRLRTDRCEAFQLDHGLHVLPVASPLCRQWLDADALQLCPFDHVILIRPSNQRTDVRSRTELDRLLQASGRALPLAWQGWDDEGPLAVPAEGIAAIPRQLAARLPAGTLHTHRSVERVGATAVQTSDEEEYHFEQLVVATEAPAAQRLLGAAVPDVPWQAVTCLHFATAQPPVDQRALVLAADPAGGPVDQLAVISNVAPRYAPAGQSLVSVNVTHDRGGAAAALDDPNDLETAVRTQLARWFGDAVHRWRLLRVYHLPYGLPAASSPPAAADRGPIVCGDYCIAPSIEGALRSGLQAAEAVRRRLG